MGVVDEHWCSKCKKDLDKKQDTYTKVGILAFSFAKIVLKKKVSRIPLINTENTVTRTLPLSFPAR